MRGVLSSVREKLTGRTTIDGRETPDETVADADRASLFECPACETVYIAVEMTRCSRCDVSFDDARLAPSQVAGRN